MLVRHVRDKGAMNAIISTEIFDISELEYELSKVPDVNRLNYRVLLQLKDL